MNAALKTDLYELTMAAGYFQNGLNLRAVFELYCHTMPPNRSYLVACGLEQAVAYLLDLKFSEEDIAFLQSQPAFSGVDPKFFDYLKGFRFTGDCNALPEGTVCFANEPILQIEAPIIEAQIAETYLLSMINIQTLVATKAARVTQAACSDGFQRTVVDFGSRRAHGPEAGVLAARAAYIGGCIGTSNVHAGRAFGIPLFGTMAHSWVQAFDKEETAFAKYHATFPKNTILLIDTYDTVKGAKKAVELAKELRGVRLDSGDLKTLSRQVRKILDQAGLDQVKIVASGDLNEYKIRDLVRAKAAIDFFGVGTEMVTSRDYPALDLTYKLVATIDSSGRTHYRAKKSRGKHTTPGRKQIFRFFDKEGRMIKDRLALATERPPKGSRPLLKPVIVKGKLKAALPSAERVRQKVQQDLAALPRKKKYPVEVSPRLVALRQK